MPVQGLKTIRDMKAQSLFEDSAICPLAHPNLPSPNLPLFLTLHRWLHQIHPYSTFICTISSTVTIAASNLHFPTTITSCCCCSLFSCNIICTQHLCKQDDLLPLSGHDSEPEHEFDPFPLPVANPDSDSELAVDL